MERTLELQVGRELLELGIPQGTTAGDVIAVLVRRRFLATGQAYVAEYAGRRLDATQRLDDLDLEEERTLRVITASGEVPRVSPPSESGSLSDTDEPSVEPPGTETEDPAYNKASQTLRKLRMINRGLVDFRIKDPDQRIFQVNLKYRTTALYKTPRGDLPTVMIGNEVEVQIPPDYPQHGPEFVWMSRIFHPNIVTGETVQFIGRTSPARLTLEDGLRCLVDMLQYKKGWYHLDNVADKEAAQWAADNRDLFPLGEKSLITELSGDDSGEEGEAAETELPLSEETIPIDLPLAVDEAPGSPEPKGDEAGESLRQTPDANILDRVRITLRGQDKEIDVRLPATTSLMQLTEAVLPRLSMPATDDVGEPIGYSWLLVRTGQRLVQNLGLAEQGIVDGDVIALSHEQGA